MSECDKGTMGGEFRPTVDDDFFDNEDDDGSRTGIGSGSVGSEAQVMRTPRDRLVAAKSLDAHIASHVLEEAVMEDLRSTGASDMETKKVCILRFLCCVVLCCVMLCFTLLDSVTSCLLSHRLLTGFALD